jgi:hypothetical protein
LMRGMPLGRALGGGRIHALRHILDKANSDLLPQLVAERWELRSSQAGGDILGGTPI